MTGSILGTRVVRSEDPELLRGEGRYVADLELPGALQVAFVRSPIAHAVLQQIHVDEALAAPGVVAVWTAVELDVAPHHGFVKVHDDFARPPLAVDRLRFVGDPFAAVFAETAAAATDAADLVWAELDPLPPVCDPEAALMQGSPVVFDDHGSNVAMALTDRHVVDLEAISDVVVRGRYVNQRVAVAPMEVDCCAAAPDEDGRIVVWPSTQMPHMLRDQLASALGWDPSTVRVVTPRVGGGFGGKAGAHPEHVVVTKAAQVFNRPVVWVPTRSEDMRALPHSRGQIQYAELGCRRDGTFTGMRVRLVGDAGAYPTIGAFLPGGTRRMAQGTYDIPAVQFDVAVAVTTTTPMGAFRGAGRPEATALIERLVHQAALELDIDPIELRIRNFIRDDAFPFRTLTGNTYDSGRYALALRAAADAVGYDALRAEQASRRARGDRRLLGIGVAAYVEITAGGSLQEFGRVDVHDDGTATVYAGTSAHGQGHRTAYAMLVAEQTGIPIDAIELVDGDTDQVPQGGGTGGSRSLQTGGSAVSQATEQLVRLARDVAARELEAAVEDVVLDTDAGVFHVRGVPARALSWPDVASRSSDPLTANAIFSQDNATFPFGAHVAVVEVDSDTGLVDLVRHVAVDDCGRVLNPLLVEGQQHGGIAAGVGQALFEQVCYDGDGNLLTATLADYCMPSAADLPSFETVPLETPTPLNPLGAKGIGEAATIGSTPAVQNAVIDAVSHVGIRHIDLPCTPERVWRAIAAAEAGTPPDPWRDPPPIFTKAESSAETVAGIAAAEGI